jgi:RNA polymerase sigma factor (sigma-70 family)
LNGCADVRYRSCRILSHARRVVTTALLSLEEQVGLVRRVGGGDGRAEEELVRIFRPRVLTMLRARLRDDDVARELASDVLMSVLFALRERRIHEPEKLIAYVHGTARNLANNYIRTRSRQPLELELSPEVAVVDPAEERERAERIDWVREELKRLDPTDRRILLLTLLESLKPGEIADRLGLSSEVVRARKSRALKKIVESTRARHETESRDHQG